MDYGLLIDNNGCKLDFCNVVLVLIINIGVESIFCVSIGFMD